MLNVKQCRSRSAGFFRSQLIWIYTVCNGRPYRGSAGLGYSWILLYFKVNHWMETFSLTKSILDLLEVKQDICFLPINKIQFWAKPWENWPYVKTQSVHLVSVIRILTLVLLNLDMPCFCKQCRSRSVGFCRSKLIWLYTVWDSVLVSTIWIK